MNNQEDSFLQPDQNQHIQFPHDNENLISISAEHISAKPNQVKGTSKKSTIQDNLGRMIFLQKQNSRLRKRNQQLNIKLELFSQKLDKQLQKRSNSQNKKQNCSIKIDESIQIKNAYKKIQIYKRQIYMLRNKLSTEDNESKMHDYQTKLKSYMAENQELRQQIKTINKILKQQERGLTDIGAEGFLKINQENIKNKDQVRKLLIELDQLKRKNQNNQNNSHKLKKGQNFDEKEKSFQSENRKKTNSSFRMRTEPKLSKAENDDISGSGQQKSNTEKLQQKIKKANFDKNRQKQIIQNLKTQLSQKDKQLIHHKQKIQNLRVTIKFLKKKSETNNKLENNEENSQSSLNKNLKTINESEGQRKDSERRPPQPAGGCPDQYKIQQVKKVQTQINQHNKCKYPRLQAKGLKSQGNLKWNHHEFSSKIKQIQIYYHELGFINSIHIVYEKGQPAKAPDTDTLMNNCFKCSENQYIQEFEGKFQAEYICQLSVKTNLNRRMSFSKVDSESYGHHFKFNINSFEFPCALFGENDKRGIKRLGCFIDKKGLLNDKQSI